MKRLITVLALSLLSWSMPTLAEYAIPSARRIDWYPAGLDVVGGIPTTFTSTNTLSAVGLNVSAINNAISAAASNTVVALPAGTFSISGNINMKSGVVLRGAKAVGEYGTSWLPAAAASATTLTFSGNCVNFDGGSKENSWTPGQQSGTSITAGYSQGSTSLTVSSAASYAIGDYICVYQNNDSSLVNDRGYSWLGEDTSPTHCWAQYTKITNKSGSVLTIDPPLYQVTPSPSGQSIRKQSMGVAMAGLENIRIQNDGGGTGIIKADFSRHCWIKGCETYLAGHVSSGSPHVWIEFCHSFEIRKNYFHAGANHDSGQSYGVEFYHWNSRHKVEDNIVRETRHSIVFEGGGSGCVIAYNYTDDNWESVQGAGSTRDSSFLSEDEVSNHGAHPYMNLWEGNFGTSLWGDWTQGSSSHITWFRNNMRGRQTSYSLSSPWAWSVIEIENYNRYYNVIGNVLGNPSFTSGTVIDNGGGGSLPRIFAFGYDGAGHTTYVDPQSRSTAVLHGNYDFITDGIPANGWDGGADHSIANSLYYTNGVRPGWFGDRTWPPVNNASISAAAVSFTNLPAGYRYTFGTEPGAGGGDVSSPLTIITSPTSSSTYDNGSGTTINLGGTMSDNAPASVTWSNDRGGSGNASGTTSWTILGIPLQTGANVITVTGFDTSNNSGSDTITVTVAGALIGVIATNAYFSEIITNNAYTNVFVLTNTAGSGTVSGTATIGGGSPWSIVGNANYALTTAQATNISVKFNPTFSGAFTNQIVFSGGGGATNIIAGRGVPLFASYSNMPVVNFLVESPFAADSGSNYVSQTVEVSGAPLEGGRAAAFFTLTSITNLSMSVFVTAQTSGSDSFYIALDGEPSDPTNICDILPVTSTAFAYRTVAQRGNGTAAAPQWTNYVWTNVSAGTHEVIIRGREADCLIQYLTINPISTAGSSDTTPPSLSITNPTSGATYTATNTPITIGGVANDNVGLSSLVWETDRGASGSSANPTNWTGSLALQTGYNVLTVTAYDTSNNSTNRTLTIFYGDTNVYNTVIRPPFGVRPLP